MSPSVARATWSWYSLPYSVFWEIQQRFSEAKHIAKKVNTGGDDGTRDIDHWILQNENWLRQRRIQNKDAAWETGLVTLGNSVWSLSTLEESYRRISRVQVDGFVCLDARRSPSIYIQPNNDAFSKKFQEITNGQLKGLDWSNIFVAGGIVLGALLCVDAEASVHNPEQWKGSDIDIYIYGLDPVKATVKIEHLFDVFTRNLPEGEEVLVVRNTKTISFLSSYPHRRFQIILKICPSPAEVLLNFDLDICAMGYDGNQFYMLPRAARALETGYNVFTMDMVQGHYLGTRRASQEQRVFKYANKGYGIRILPSYIEALKSIDVSALHPEDRLSSWGRENTIGQAHDGLDAIEIKRIVYGNSIKEVLSQNLFIGVFMPNEFVDFAESIIKQITDDHPYLSSQPLITKLWTPNEPIIPNSALYGVTISPSWMFQQFDRRLDEIFEIIWSFMFTQGVTEEEDDDRYRRFQRQLSRRAIRAKPEDEFKDFASWISRKPGGISGYNYGAMGQGFWYEVAGEDED
ncbi:hypothetical protein FRC17_003608 [Serendipita sp. 399]|nr:hypothetical protein FRC17_003608 [Serendipita sp. 399]